MPRKLLAAAFFVIPAALIAGSVTLPNTFSNGQRADASQVNANFEALAAAVNDNDTRLEVIEAGGGPGGGTAPLVDWASPSSLPLSGGTVVLQGHAFDPPVEVSVGGVTVETVEVLSRTRLRFIAPALEEGSVPVTVSNASGKSDTHPTAFTYVAGSFPDTAALSRIWQVSTAGDDGGGTGDAGAPFRTVKRAIEAASSGDGIFIDAGTYRTVPMTASGRAVAFDDLGKHLTIWGLNQHTILEVYGVDSSSATYRDANVFHLQNANTTISNLTIHYAPNRGANYSNAVFSFSTGTLRNVSIVNISPSVSMSMIYYNGGPAQTPKFYNVNVKSNGRLTSDYSGAPLYVNGLFDATPSNGTKAYSLTRAITGNDDSTVTLPADLLEQGDPAVLNPDGTRSHIGVGGGLYAWP